MMKLPAFRPNITILNCFDSISHINGKMNKNLILHLHNSIQIINFAAIQLAPWGWRGQDILEKDVT